MAKTSLAKTTSPFYTYYPFIVDDTYDTLDSFVSRVFDTFFGGGYNKYTRSFGRTYYPSVDVFEEGDDLVFYAQVPGMSKEQLTVEIKDGVLYIKGDTVNKEDSDSSKEGRKRLISEISASSFVRSFILPDYISSDYDTSRIKAKLNNGILEVRLEGVRAEKDKKDKVITVSID